MMKKTNKNKSMGMALGMCFGVSLGTAFGSMIGNTSLGLSMGPCLGLVIGLALGALKDKEVNKQLLEKGYTIKTITSLDEKQEYVITIVNHLGEESDVVVPKGQMEEETFEIGDVVFLDEDGMIEQAYDKEDEEK
jgi:hypothetical protein